MNKKNINYLKKGDKVFLVEFHEKMGFFVVNHLGYKIYDECNHLDDVYHNKYDIKLDTDIEDLIINDVNCGSIYLDIIEAISIITQLNIYLGKFISEGEPDKLYQFYPNGYNYQYILCASSKDEAIMFLCKFLGKRDEIALLLNILKEIELETIRDNYSLECYNRGTVLEIEIS